MLDTKRGLMKRSQIILEYISAISVGFIIVFIFIFFFSKELHDTEQKKELFVLRDIAQSIQKEIYLASEVEPGYSRNFEVPEDIDGTEYTIENSGNKLILRTEKYDVVLTIPELKGSIRQGANIIRSIHGLICLGNVTCLDEVSPEILFSSPSGTLTINTAVLNVTADENCVCKYSDSDINYFSMRDFMEGSGTEHSITLSPGEGSYNYYVRCKDETGNAMQNSTIISFIIDLPDITPPSIFLSFPVDDFNTSDNNQIFFYIVADESSITSCKLILDGSVKATENTIIKEQLLNFTEYLDDSDYNWSINCTDSHSNTNNSLHRMLRIDSAGPQINLSYPEDNITFNYSYLNASVFFGFNVSDAHTIAGCDLFINGTLNATLSNVISIENNLNATLNGFYNWNINCSDSFGNSGGSQTRSLVVI